MSDQQAKIHIDVNRTVAEISPLLFGGFAEHMGRCIYEGIYDPKSPRADERGFRTDVLDALRDQQYTIMRYPGGNFLSGYNWLDGVGPKEQRPRRRELAWQSIETNQFGTNEFLEFCTAINCEPMMAVNLGTGTIEGASSLVEYCNAPRGTHYADLRASHGYADPYNIKYWCLGNEMDGPWQIGHLDMDEYARKARSGQDDEVADPSIKLISCGSSNNRMPTYPEWDRFTLETCWELVDYHSIHYYAGNREEDSTSYLALAVELEDFVDTMAATLRYAKAKRRSTHDVYLSWDEWQVWYKDRGGRGGWTEAPHLCEEIYNLEDALVVAQWLNVFLRKADVLKVACVAQIVNIISWLQTRNDGLLVQTSFYPFKLVSNLARGNALDLFTQAPVVETPRYGGVSALDVSASHDPVSGAQAVFIVNRSQTDAINTEIVWQSAAPQSVKQAWQLSGADLKAANTWENPNHITAQAITPPAIQDGRAQITLPPLSFTALSIG
ncbi:MAG: alpha-L-arabinofuranosidase C-terminal domain-containing protein [Caldilineaceae bacterium]